MADILNGNDIKNIAYYLPQFHAIPENDRAWGKGFTEWTNTKKAQPLFEGHYQPKVPLNQNYYSLLDVNVMIRQSELAKEYGVFGFCYYHYWFKDGKKLLEKPIEMMLNDKRVDIPFCLSWANENWSKLWDGGNREVIVEQDYGNESDWKAHFEYLVQFFQDERYITLDGCPVFIIYRPSIIPNVQKMMKYWNELAQQYGFKKICFMIQSADLYYSPIYIRGEFAYQIKFPPFYATTYLEKDMEKLKRLQKIGDLLGKVHCDKLFLSVYKKAKSIRDNKKTAANNSYTILEYDSTWKALLDSEAEDFLIEGAFVDWDNTARKKNGYVHVGGTPEKFSYYMSRLYEKIANNKQCPVVFINAWNEWCEGAYLEPDEQHKYAYLEALKRAKENDLNV